MRNLKLEEFLAHSVELESEAQERYLELADTMAAHHNREVADFFRRMAMEASNHLREVSGLASGLTLPPLKPWEFSWPGEEPPETASYEALHYRMSLRQAIELALANERAAEAFYRSVANSSEDAETARVATGFADEELEHAAALEKLLASLPANGSFTRLEDDDPVMPE